MKPHGFVTLSFLFLLGAKASASPDRLVRDTSRPATAGAHGSDVRVPNQAHSIVSGAQNFRESQARPTLASGSTQETSPGYRILHPDVPIRIPFDVHRGDIRMVGEVNGRPVRILIDNGILWDDLLFFGSPLVDSLGFGFQGEVDVRGSGKGAALESRTTLGVVLRFPGVEFFNQRAVVTPYVPGAPNMWEGSEGQISAALFKNFVVRIDFDEMVITLTPPERFRHENEGIELPMTKRASGMWAVPAALGTADGKQIAIDLAVDLGNSNPLQISTGGSLGFDLPGESFAASLGFGIQGEVLGHFGPTSELTLGEVKLEDVLTAFDEGNEFEEAMIGFALLSRFNLTFDYPQNRLILEANSHFADPFEFSVSGAVLRSALGDGVRVGSVYPGSPAAVSGLMEGDQVLEVGGVDVTQYDLFQLGSVLGAAGPTATLSVRRNDSTISVALPNSRARFIVNSERFSPVPAGFDPGGHSGSGGLCPAPLIIDGHTHMGFGTDASGDVVTDSLDYIAERGYHAVGLGMPLHRRGPADLPTELSEEIRQLHALSQELGTFALVRTPEEVLQACDDGKLAVLLTLEDLDGVFGADAARVDRYQELGVRSITLVNNDNDHDRLMDRGEYTAELTPLGLEVISRMNGKGVLVDITHLWPQEMMAVVEASEQPVIASHSNPRGAGAPNSPLFDEVVKAVAEKGGLIMLSFNTDDLFLEDEDQSGAVDRLLGQMDHVRALVGIGHVGIGTDLQAFGRYVPDELGQPSAISNLQVAMAERGYSQSDIQKVLAGNFLKLLGNVNQTP